VAGVAQDAGGYYAPWWGENAQFGIKIARET
jgi:hypothetical protein